MSSGTRATPARPFITLLSIPSCQHRYSSPIPRCINLPGPALTTSTPNQSMRPVVTSAGPQASRYFIEKPNGYIYPTFGGSIGWSSPSQFFPALFNENSINNKFLTQNGISTANTYLYDADGVLRPGDGYLGSSPFITGQTAGRPIILHRPFRSVAEMGYTYRGSMRGKQ